MRVVSGKIFLLAPLLVVLTEHPLFAEQAKALNHGNESLAAFYQAILGANQTIDVATYEFAPCDASTKVLFKALIEKAAKGVKVRFLVDPWTVNSGLLSGIAAYADEKTKRNLELRTYPAPNPAGTHSHVKTLLVDHRAHITGGRNWTDDYFGLGDKMNYLDQDVFIEGSSAGTVQAQYEELWRKASRVGTTTLTPYDSPYFERKCFAALNAKDKKVEQFLKDQSASLFSSLPARSCPNAVYAMDAPSPVDSSKRSTALVLRFLSGTKSKLSLVNQFYFPWEKIKTAMAGLPATVHSAEVFANASADFVGGGSFTCWLQSSGYQLGRTKGGARTVHLLTSRGALQDAWELSPHTPWRIHTKTGIRDDQDVLVSSWNIGPRSYALNLEDAVELDGCPALAGDLDGQYDQLRKIVEQDKSCVACAKEISPAYQTSTSCGGTPSLY